VSGKGANPHYPDTALVYMIARSGETIARLTTKIATGEGLGIAELAELEDAQRTRTVRYLQQLDGEDRS